MSGASQSKESDSVLVGRRSQWGFVSVFLLFLVWPWIVELVSPGGTGLPEQGGSLQSQLKQLEQRVKKFSFFENERSEDQAFMEEVFREGNAKVFIGQEDWLYYRPDLEAVYGKGSSYREPSSVTREKVTDVWSPPLEVIDEFARQLEDRGIKLLIVPVPTKPMLCPSGLGLEQKRLEPGHYLDVLSDLSKRGIETLDLLPVIEALPESSRFLKQDTHWTPMAMSAAAKQVAATLSGNVENPEDDSSQERWALETRTHSGDLAGMLDRGEVKGQEVVLKIPGGVITDDIDSNMVLLGDSFVNIYDEPGLGFSDENGERLGAGFAAHLSANLNRSIQTMAINGDGATAVRREFASLPDKVIRSKETVVWVLSARDLLLAEIPARRAGIRWAPVAFREAEATLVGSKELTIYATVSKLSKFDDPRETAYKDAVYSQLLTELEVEKGVYPKEEVFAFAWAFENRVLQESSRLEQGKRYRFTLVPLKDAEAVSNATQVDDLFRTDLDPWFIEEFEVVD